MLTILCLAESTPRSSPATRPRRSSSRSWRRRTRATTAAPPCTPPTSSSRPGWTSPSTVSQHWNPLQELNEPISVGITWEDAPRVQYASLDEDYKVRCVVRANPPANIDWLKESLIISTGTEFYFRNQIVVCSSMEHINIYFYPRVANNPVVSIKHHQPRQMLPWQLICLSQLISYSGNFVNIDINLMNTLYLHNQTALI